MGQNVCGSARFLSAILSVSSTRCLGGPRRGGPRGGAAQGHAAPVLTTRPAGGKAKRVDRQRLGEHPCREHPWSKHDKGIAFALFVFLKRAKKLERVPRGGGGLTRPRRARTWSAHSSPCPGRAPCSPCCLGVDHCKRFRGVSCALSPVLKQPGVIRSTKVRTIVYFPLTSILSVVLFLPLWQFVLPPG